MSQFQVKLSAAALEELKGARLAILEKLGNRKIGARLTNLSPEDAGDLANALLTLLDAVDRLTGRAKPI
ncbi:MAG: hypothetical protein R3F62_23830 [Planctomycetota bacterium]